MLRLFWCVLALALCSCITTTYVYPAKYLVASPAQVLPPAGQGLHMEGGAGIGAAPGKLNRESAYGSLSYRWHPLLLGLGGSLERGNTSIEADSCYEKEDIGGAIHCYSASQLATIREGGDWWMATVAPTVGLVGAWKYFQLGASYSLVYAHDWGDYSRYRKKVDDLPQVDRIGGDSDWYNRIACWMAVPLGSWRLGLQFNIDTARDFERGKDDFQLLSELNGSAAIHAVVQRGPWQFIAGQDDHGIIGRIQYQVPFGLGS